MRIERLEVAQVTRERLEQAVFQHDPRERLQLRAPVGFLGGHERVERHVGEQLGQPRPREHKRDTGVEGMRQFVDDQQIGESRQAGPGP